MQDATDIHGFSNRKWWILTLSKISKPCFSLIYFLKNFEQKYLKQRKITKFSVRKSMNIHRILQFGLKLIKPGRLWKCKEYVPQIMNLLCKITSLFYPYLPELFFPKFIWNLFFPPMWSILHLNIETRTQDGMDIHRFPNRKWWILTLFKISKACFSLIYF